MSGDLLSGLGVTRAVVYEHGGHGAEKGSALASAIALSQPDVVIEQAPPVAGAFEQRRAMLINTIARIEHAYSQPEPDQQISRAPRLR